MPPVSGPIEDMPPPGTDDLEELSSGEPQRQVQLLADGRLRAPSSDTREMLRQRLGRAEMLATGAEWAVFRNLDAPEPTGDLEAAVARKQVVCCGTMREAGISLIDFIGFLASGHHTGVVTVSHAEVERSIFLHQGDVVWAASSSPVDRLGEFLVRRGKLTREQLQTAVQRHGVTRIGRACVECGFISAHELWNMVQGQLTEIFDLMLRTEDGMWTFSRIGSDALAESKIHLSTQGLLVDALRRLDEMKVYRSKIYSSDVLVQRTQLPEAEQRERLARVKDLSAADAESVLRNAPRAVTIHELMRIVGKGEFEVTRIVHHLLRLELVQIVSAETTTGPVPRRTEQIELGDAQEVIQVYSMALEEMASELSGLDLREALLGTARAFIQDQTVQHASVLRHIELHADGTIDEGLALTFRGSVDALNAALSELLFFVLFQATDLLGPKKGDDLARRIKVILALLTHSERGSA